MKKYKSSDLTHKRAEVMEESAVNGVIIQELRTNGDVRREFILVSRDAYRGIESIAIDKLADIAVDELLEKG